MNANRLLGYPDDARLLIINADDFGLSHSGNEATLRAWRDGVVSSTSLMVPCPWAWHAIGILRANPDLPFGVHLTMIREFDQYRWGPVASREAVPSLVDAHGHFLKEGAQREELLRTASIDDVEREFRAQIDTVIDAGLQPTHLDWHCLPDGGREDIFDLTVELAREYGLALRTHYPHHAETCHNLRLPANDHEVLDSYRMVPATKTEEYLSLMRDLPAGLSEWAVHPGLGNDESRALEPDTWNVRRGDLDAMLSPEVRRGLDEHGITLIDYRALQSVWNTAGSHPQRPTLQPPPVLGE